MPERTSYTQGTPNWVDLPTSDQAAAKAFYAGLFGWTYDDQPMGEGQIYSMAVLNGHQVAAISPQPPEMAAAGSPPMWNTYLAVDSVDEATAKVEAAGGKVAMAPFDVMDAGRMSFVMDPSGAPVALWQAGQHIGATLVNEPGTINWNELVTSDQGATRFYADVAGLTIENMDMGEGQSYTVFKSGEAGKEFFRSILPGAPEVEVKPMFGNLGAFVPGNMFAGLFGSSVGVRLAEPDAAVLSVGDGSGPFGPAERPMGGYLSLPSGMDPDLAAQWVEKARVHVGSLPPKAKKAAKKT